MKRKERGPEPERRGRKNRDLPSATHLAQHHVVLESRLGIIAIRRGLDHEVRDGSLEGERRHPSKGGSTCVISYVIPHGGRSLTWEHHGTPQRLTVGTRLHGLLDVRIGRTQVEDGCHCDLT